VFLAEAGQVQDSARQHHQNRKRNTSAEQHSNGPLNLVLVRGRNQNLPVMPL
jgi:hypothetical protein